MFFQPPDKLKQKLQAYYKGLDHHEQQQIDAKAIDSADDIRAALTRKGQFEEGMKQDLFSMQRYRWIAHRMREIGLIESLEPQRQRTRYLAHHPPKEEGETQ